MCFLVDTSLKDGLFHEYKKHGKVTSVKVIGAANDRYALVCFKKPEDVVKAIEVSRDKSFFGCLIDVSPYHGYVCFVYQCSNVMLLLAVLLSLV